jgi:hypothetical protein
LKNNNKEPLKEQKSANFQFKITFKLEKSNLIKVLSQNSRNGSDFEGKIHNSSVKVVKSLLVRVVRVYIIN